MDLTRAGLSLAAVLALVCLALPAGASAAEQPAVPPSDTIDRAADYLLDMKDEEGCIAPNGYQSPTLTDWAAQAMAAAGRDPGSGNASLADGLVACEPQEPEDDTTGYSPNWVAAQARHLLGIAAVGGDATDFNGTDWISQLRSYHDGVQFRDPKYPNVINDDAFAIMALRAAGVPADDEDIQASADTILNAQNADGGWSYTPGGPSDTDDTAAMLEALRAARVVEPDDTAVQRAEDYLASNAGAQDTGCFEFSDTFDGANTDSTTWATMGLLAIHNDPRAKPWGVDGGPWDCLRDKQLDSGAFPSSTSTVADPYTTTQAIMALAGVPHGRATPDLDRPTPAPEVAPEPVVSTTSTFTAEAAFASWQHPNGTVSNASTTTWTPTEPGQARFDLLALAEDGTAQHVVLEPTARSPEPRAYVDVLTDDPTDGAPVTLDDRSYDPNPEGGIADRAWAFGDGDTLADADARVDHRYPDEGTYEACVSVEDAQGLTNETCRPIDVANAVPSAAISGPDPIPHVDETVTYEAQALDPSTNGEVTDHAWAFGDGTTANGSEVEHAFDEAGTYEVSLEVTDDDGAAAYATLTQPVGNREPVLELPSDPSIKANRTLETDVDARDANADPVTFGHEGLPEDATLDADTGQLTWRPTTDDVGTTEITVTADDGRETSNASLAIDVEPNQPPEVTLDVPSPVEAGEPVDLGASAEDPDGPGPVTLAWDVDEDGRIEATGSDPTVELDGVGQRSLVVHARDADGIHARSTVAVTVDDAVGFDAELFGPATDAYAPTRQPVLAFQLLRDDGSPVAHESVRVAVDHAALGEVSNTTVRTGDGGVAQFHVPWDIGDERGVNVPGEHTLELSVATDSRPAAPIDDTERARATIGYVVEAPG